MCHLCSVTFPILLCLLTEKIFLSSAFSFIFFIILFQYFNTPPAWNIFYLVAILIVNLHDGIPQISNKVLYM